jgi:uridine kinase
MHESENKYLHKKLDITELYELSHVKSIIIDNKPLIPIIYQTEKQINMYYQWYKIYRVFSIIENVNNYDYIVRIRSDLFILQNIDEIFNKFSKNKLYIPLYNDIYDINCKINEASINDQIAIADPNTMAIYTNLFHNIYKYTSSNTCSEIVLAKYLNEKNIQVERFPLDYKLVLSMCNIIGISGNSSSGKTNITRIIEKIFKFNNQIILETDRYHKWERNDINWNNYTHLNPHSNYLEKLKEDTFNLKIGNDIYAVDYDHTNGKFTSKQQIKSKNNIILCGLHTLYNNSLRDIIDIKVYMNTQETLQYYWKLKRDVMERNHIEENVINSIKNRQKDYEKYILPQKQYSDIIIEYYTKQDIDINQWKVLEEPDIFLKIHLKNTTYNIIESRLKYFQSYFELINYNNNIISLEINNNINKVLIFEYLQNNNLDFIQFDDIYNGYYGMIQIIFIMILYK